MAEEIRARLDFALEASAQAARLVMSHFQSRELSVEYKADESPVTVADRGAEELLRAKIQSQFPDDAILGEEFGETGGASGFRWILDPIDGTKSFVHGVPLFGMLVGLLKDEEPVAGICRHPALNELIYARRGGGAWWQVGDEEPVAARVRETATLSESLCCFTALEGFEQIGRADVLLRMAKTCRLSRGWGDCYGHMLVATGRADVMIDPLLETWDAAALLPIVLEAGGEFIDWKGEATIRGGNGISVVPALRSEVLAMLRADS